MVAIDLNQQHALDADPKSIQQINFNGNINGNNSRLRLRFFHFSLLIFFVLI